MNRTIEDATVKRFHYDSHDQFRHHLADFVTAIHDPHHQIRGPDIWMCGRAKLDLLKARLLEAP